MAKSVKVKPQEPTVVYMKASKFHKHNEEVTMHRALAEKMIASGKASAEPMGDTQAAQNTNEEITEI